MYFCLICRCDNCIPEIGNVTDFAPEVIKEDADDALYSDPHSLEPPYLFYDHKGTTQTPPLRYAERGFYFLV